MSTTAPIEEITLDEGIIFDSTVPCDGVFHDLGTWGHVPEATAAFRLLLPCGLGFNKCAGNVAELQRRGGRLHCRKGCGQRHPMNEITFRPL